MTQDRLSQLIDQYLAELLTDSEREELVTALDNDHWASETRGIIEGYLDAKEFNFQPDLENLYARIEEAVKAECKPVRSMRPLRRMVAAAVFILGIAGTYMLLHKSDTADMQTQAQRFRNDVAPGKVGAILRLSDGREILLDTAKDGSVIPGFTKSGEGLEVKASAVEHATVIVPKARKEKLVLPDGSIVWLNAASSISFPTSFSGAKREVAITGEAYFEVAKNASMPFIVTTNGMKVEVLGTHFNINSYSDEPVIKTTLLEGKVKVTTVNGSHAGNVFLLPGQQSQLNSRGDIKLIHDVDVEETVAWKDGKFNFNGNDIESVMRQLEKWYDVKVEYKGALTKEGFVGIISRQVNISRILAMLESTRAVSFEIKGRRVIVK
jgi:transmembrane sensor